ncbi:MAG: EscU/YscU/HrcU family type III secretion system export apparatus switch protein [Rhodoferax sp.]|nr:EscU/YscU/HrcU family type III secretion system export apparatus switch protein [Rhodoferax sp.]
MDSSSQDRNLPASERKLKKARDDGQVARSRNLANLAVLGGGCVTLLLLAPLMFERIRTQLGWQLRFDAQTLKDPLDMINRLGAMSGVGLAACTLFAAVLAVIAIVGTIATGGWVASIKPILPDFSRLNPISGLGRLFTKEKATEVLKMSFIAAMLLWIGFSHLSAGMDTLGALVLQPSAKAVTVLSDWIAQGVALMLLVLLVVALVDVPLQNYLHRSRLKMSHQELKQETKESDGNPQMKGRLRQRQRDLAQGNSVKAVPKADFVLMNPTHYAVALRYDEQTMDAPRVLAKGADLLAFKIRDLAREHEIPVLQSPVLARALYTHAELDQDIPASLFTAVAQVLAYIYRLKAALRGDGPMPQEAPTPWVPPELDPLSGVLTAQAL